MKRRIASLIAGLGMLVGMLVFTTSPASAVATTVWSDSGGKYGVTIFSNSNCTGVKKILVRGSHAGPPQPPLKLYWVSAYQYTGTTMKLYHGKPGKTTEFKTYSRPTKRECRSLGVIPDDNMTIRIY